MEFRHLLVQYQNQFPHRSKHYSYTLSLRIFWSYLAIFDCSVVRHFISGTASCIPNNLLLFSAGRKTEIEFLRIYCGFLLCPIYC